MFTLLSLHVHEQEIKRSRFIATAGPIADEDGAKAFIATHSVGDANHNCWAWRIGSGGLIRAYGGTASLCLRGAEKLLILPSVEVRIDVTFSDLALVKARLFALADVRLTEECFTESGAELTVSLPETGADDALAMVTDLTSGHARIDRGS